MSIYRLLGLTASILLSVSVWADDANFYIGIDQTKTQFRFDGVRFQPEVPKLHIGYYVKPRIALELEYGKGGRSDEKLKVLMNIMEYSSFNTRLESFQEDGVKAYAIIGYQQSVIKVFDQNQGVVNTELNLKGAKFAFGFNIDIKSYEPLSWYIQGSREYTDDNLTINSAAIGLELVF